MFTVIICDQAIIEDCTTKYELLLRPLMANQELVFCAWNSKEASFDRALPGLREIIKPYRDWRAVIVYDRHIQSEELLHQTNPFDYVNGGLDPVTLSNRESVYAFREKKACEIEKAIDNPLMRLSVWLGGFMPKNRPELPGEETLIQSEPFSREYLEVLEKERIDAKELEEECADVCRYDALNKHFLSDGELFCPPKVLLAVAECAKNREENEAQEVWKNHTEFEYSSFAGKNLYSSELRFTMFRMPRIRGELSEQRYFSFLTTLLILASNEIPLDLLKRGRVYELITDLNDVSMKKAYNTYLYKLAKTVNRLRSLQAKAQNEGRRPLPDEILYDQYEAGVVVPVRKPEGFEVSNLMCEGRKIGLSSDCPGDEGEYWKSQSEESKKRFGRFLRQPQRMVRNAVELDFAAVSSFEDIKARRLKPYQQEELVRYVQEEERQMVETDTCKVFDPEVFDAEIKKAKKEVDQGFGKRMSRTITIALGLFLLAFVALGYLPMVISDLNNPLTGSLSLLLLLASVVVVAAAIILTLLLQRYQLIRKIKEYNTVIHGLYKGVMDAMQSFSTYLSHAANVMRGFAVLNRQASGQNRRMNVFRMHEMEIIACMEAVKKLFPEMLLNDYEPETTVFAYDYDFEVPTHYQYDVTCQMLPDNLEYLYKGAYISVPVDYVERIGLKRLELYD